MCYILGICELTNGGGTNVVQPEFAQDDVMDTSMDLVINVMLAVMKLDVDGALWPDLE